MVLTAHPGALLRVRGSGGPVDGHRRGDVSHRAYHHQVDISNEHFERINFGLAKGASVTLAIYLAIKIVALALEDEWHYLATGWGAWYLFEIIGFVVLPCALFAVAYRERNLVLARTAAVITVLGIVLNRFNATFIVFNYQLPASERYVPSWMEIWVTVAFITFAVVVFRWIANRMPIMYEHPDWRGQH